MRRPLVGVLAAGLTASGLAFAAPAQAADEPVVAPVAALNWKISDTATTALSTRTFSGGATQDADSVISFPAGTGYYDSGNGSAFVSYEGSAALSFVFNDVTQYTVNIGEPRVIVAADGQGTVTAVVSGFNAAGQGSPASSTQPARVTVATFDVDDEDWSIADGLANVTVTPDWLGNVNPGSDEAAALGITSPTLPWSGKSFNYGFMQQITPGVRARFYASGAAEDTASNNAKKPADITFSVATPKTAITTTSATPAGGLNLTINGTGFTRVTNPGDTGVYVGLAPAGGLPDTSQFDTSAFAGANWVPANGIDETTGAFTTTLNAPSAKLDPTKSYSVYTWRAHTHSTTSQNTETPVEIDFAALTEAVKVTSAPSVNVASSAYGSGRTVTVTVPKVGASVPTGTVKLSGASALSATLSNGKATFALPRTLGAGKKTLTATYSGDTAYNAATGSRAFTVTKAKVSVKRNKIKKPTTKKTGRTSLTLRSTPGGPAVSGKVKVTFKKKGQKTKTKTVTIKNGKGNVTIPKLAKGTWKITIKYNGSANFAKTATLKRGSIKVTK